MKTLSLTATILLAALSAAAQDAPPPPPMNDEMMKFIEAMSPNENHKKLGMFVGRWDYQASMWMEGPDKPPSTDRGGAVISWTLGNRYLKQEAKGTFMGMPFEGYGLTGYDNLKKTYTTFWIDNTSTAMMVAAGQIDAAGTTLTFTGTMDDPVTGRKNIPVKHVLRKTEADRFVYEMYEVPAKGPDVKMGELVYTKAKEHN